ncbi:hypothetical protein [Balneola vulgaris]|uniref:hypothetical protein n=1 Tax=Balneola vulgaris TaxID=287535 RepID=UPI000378E422|nr:hypothetical protein [Balneola vulgaris]
MKKLFLVIFTCSLISCEKKVEVKNIVSFTNDFKKYGAFHQFEKGDQKNIIFQLFSIPDSLSKLYSKRDSLIQKSIDGNNESLQVLRENGWDEEFTFDINNFTLIRNDTFLVTDNEYNISFDQIEKTDSSFELRNAGIKVVF